MSRRAIPTAMVVAMVAGVLGMTAESGTTASRSNLRREFVATAVAETVEPPNQPTGNSPQAQLFYPPVSDPQALRVTGRGRASQPADSARLVFGFGGGDVFPSPPEGILSQAEPTPRVTVPGAISEESLQPIVEGLEAIGVPAEAIEVKVIKPQPSALPFPFPSTGTPGGAQVNVTIEQPTSDRLEAIVSTVSETASASEELAVTSIGVRYAVDSCQALERAAYEAAVNDAFNRASAIASAMGAELRRVPSVAEPFYSIFLPGCDSEGNLPFGGDTTPPYDPNAPLEVEIKKEIFVTFPVE